MLGFYLSIYQNTTKREIAKARNKRIYKQFNNLYYSSIFYVAKTTVLATLLFVFALHLTEAE
jgi:hypothetical protein